MIMLQVLMIFYCITQLETTAISFVKKIVAGHLYKPEHKINANVALIKPTENYAKLQGDYGLSEVSISLAILLRWYHYFLCNILMSCLTFSYVIAKQKLQQLKVITDPC